MQPNCNTYSYSELVHELERVFRSVHFPNVRFKKRLYTSYLLCLYEMTEYARQNNIDAKEYIRGIRNVLLTCAGTYRIR